MPEKAANSVSTYSWVLRLNPMIHWSFKVLTLSVFLAVLIVWGIDGWSVSSFRKNVDLFKFSNINRTLENLSPSMPSFDHLHLPSHEEPHQDLIQTHQNLTQTHQNPTRQTQNNSSSDVATIPANLSQNQYLPNITHFSFHDSANQTTPNPPAQTSLGWISAELEQNYTSNLLSAWLAPGGQPCRDSKTVEISIPSADGKDKMELSTGHIHEVVFQALDDSGKPHCQGGDYFETDISGERWKSRPPVKDFGNGTYSFSLQVHPDFAGDYNLTVILLYRHFEGLKFSNQRFVFDRELRKTPITFYKSSVQLPELATCKKSDFDRDVWSGRWTRHGRNDNCSIDNDGRFRCLEPSFPCQFPWCHGHLGVLESNGWTYSTHCSFRLFTGEEAWNCLNGRWIFWWGDSNHCDTIRNILHFILDVQEMKLVPRRFDMNISNPRNPSQVVRITSIFNGNPNETGNYQGLNSLVDETYREGLKNYFSRETVPDTVIMNSGLHDGVFWRNIRRYTVGAERAAAFWGEVMESVRRRGVLAPEVIYRTTVASGGYARGLQFNPQKMEAFNAVFQEKLRQFGVLRRVVDHFDMTYPWHYDNRCNDGVHYGRAPLKMKWRDGEIGHQYFVDLMLCHVLLNALCAR